jgi:hypothetical protein
VATPPTPASQPRRPPATPTARDGARASGGAGSGQAGSVPAALLLQFWGLVTSEGVPDGPDTTFGTGSGARRSGRGRDPPEGSVTPSRSTRQDAQVRRGLGAGRQPEPTPGAGGGAEQVAVSTPPQDTTICRTSHPLPE